MTWKLQAITGEFTGQEISVDHDLLVGRGQDADLVLQAAEVSRKHAALLLKDDQLWVQDLNSSNGTFVNDLRIEQEVQLHEGDIIQFAGLKFSVLAPAQQNQDLPEIEVEPVVETLEQQVLKTPAQQMNDAGMPSLTERAAETSVSREGMPQSVGVPKPAPIPEGAEVKTQVEPAPTPIEQPVSRVEQEKEQQKNASVGLMTVVVIIILAVLAWLFFK
ncbi:FHA domain-containing protein [Acinetobacter ursingii]|uniref:FHA domain-containing protein n=1 Tax=Acinetobacter ursingii TaxID=108980 RepID=A0A3F3L3H3_9GAMM|nr:FHA domain-containing protein [Acinetobacter ursingii]MCU4490735.1 FHA domain-containing protein [Acinetobacter ursingii]MCU4604363.1 FHA domain-containing protein [Acinetobacter ursingii]MDA3579117.1 FHA domain-containing protein [Acinetobacter ursingii]MDG9859794.1 FHA domain-containing protein [Acinetobacter ursingii]MDG9893408.1 FHA domain-containing protein [Acinetobacter ursingii]